MIKFFLGIYLLLLSFCLAAQTSPVVLEAEEFLQLVYANHPDAVRADLLREIADANLLVARGGFDPLLYGDYYSKTFKETNYWEVSEGGIAIPTMAGLEFSAGYRTATGDFLGNEREIPVAGQAFAGVKANLLQGLLTDERRTALRRAELLRDWNQLEARSLRNELGYDALLNYLDFSVVATEVAVLNSTLSLARERLSQTVEAFEAGDRSAIDTLETAIQLRQWELELGEARNRQTAAEAMLQTYLWSADNAATNLNAIQPQELSAVQVYVMSKTEPVNALNNPELLMYTFKLSDLELEGRLKRQKLLPKLSIKYEALGDAFDFTPKDGEGNSLGDFVLNDNKFEVSFSMPLLMRSSRGEVKLNELKTRDVELQRDLKLRLLEQKILQYESQNVITVDQLAIQTELVDNYRRLLEAERIKFNIGDSSVFLLNSRENKWLSARLKLLKTQKELNKILLTRHYFGGNIAAW